MEYSIKQLAQLAGTTSRALRHYGDIGLLPPTRVAANGYRYYNAASMLELQQIMLLKRMGLSLEQIGGALTSETPKLELLTSLLESLEAERNSLNARINAVTQTITSLQNGQQMNATDALAGFNEQFKEEVVERWGSSAYQEGQDWWQSLEDRTQEEFVADVNTLNSAWITVWQAGENPHGPAAQELAERHIAWLRSIPGTPAHRGSKAETAAYVESLAHMYPADPRFASNYGGEEGAIFVRDALLHVIGK